jgi:hypothetical protein
MSIVAVSVLSSQVSFCLVTSCILVNTYQYLILRNYPVPTKHRQDYVTSANSVTSDVLVDEGEINCHLFVAEEVYTNHLISSSLNPPLPY